MRTVRSCLKCVVEARVLRDALVRSDRRSPFGLVCPIPRKLSQLLKGASSRILVIRVQAACSSPKDFNFFGVGAFGNAQTRNSLV